MQSQQSSIWYRICAIYINKLLHYVDLLKYVRHVLTGTVGSRLALCFYADLEHYGCVCDRRSQRSDHRLYSHNTEDMEDAPGDPAQRRHISRITHVVVGLDR